MNPADERFSQIYFHLIAKNYINACIWSHTAYPYISILQIKMIIQLKIANRRIHLFHQIFESKTTYMKLWIVYLKFSTPGVTNHPRVGAPNLYIYNKKQHPQKTAYVKRWVRWRVNKLRGWHTEVFQYLKNF